jgi:hypothetical protein
MAPDLLGRILGHGFLEGALGADVLPELCEPIEGAEPRRALVAASLKYLKVKPLSFDMFCYVFSPPLSLSLPPSLALPLPLPFSLCVVGGGRGVSAGLCVCVCWSVCARLCVSGNPKP